MVQIFDLSPTQSSASMIGQALGQGLGVRFQRGQMQQQQGELAKALFGDQAQQFSALPIEQQLQAAKLFEQQKNQQELSQLLSSAYQDGSQNTSPPTQENQPQVQSDTSNRPQTISQTSKGPNLTDKQISEISLKNPVLGKLLNEQKQAAFTQQSSQTKEQNRQFEADRDYHSKVSRPIIENANETIKTSNMQKGVRDQLKNDIASGNTSGMFPFIVEKLGLESFRNPESARFNNAIKNLFIGSLNEIPGARPNQFIERFLSQAQPLLGRNKEANLSVMDLSDFMEDVKLEQAKKEIEIGKEDREKYGYVKEDVAERARERMGDYINRRQEKMAIDIQKRSEENMDDTDILNQIIGDKIIPGTYVTPRSMGLLYIKNNKNIEKTIEDAKSHGMRFPEYEQ